MTTKWVKDYIKNEEEDPNSEMMQRKKTLTKSWVMDFVKSDEEQGKKKTLTKKWVANFVENDDENDGDVGVGMVGMAE